MAKQTLLALVQNILSAMDSDEVNSISDTVESMQVATIVKETYDDLVSTLDIPERRALFKLDSLSSTNQANYLRMPSTAKSLIWLKYNGVDIKWMDPEPFLASIFSTASGNTQTVYDPYQNVSYKVVSDKDPTIFTSFDDTNFVFNSFNSAAESTLQGVNSVAFGELTSALALSDSAIPDLDDDWFPVLLAEAKTSCFINLKQVSNSKEEVRSRRGLVRIQNELSKVKRSPMDRLPDYSRRR